MGPIIAGKVAIDLAVLAGVVQAAQVAAVLAGLGALIFTTNCDRINIHTLNQKDEKEAK